MRLAGVLASLVHRLVLRGTSNPPPAPPPPPPHDRSPRRHDVATHRWRWCRPRRRRGCLCRGRPPAAVPLTAPCRRAAGAAKSAPRGAAGGAAAAGPAAAAAHLVGGVVSHPPPPTVGGGWQRAVDGQSQGTRGDAPPPPRPAPTPQGAAAPGAYGSPLPSPGGGEPSRGTPPPGEPQRPPDYYANVGKVIETLRADYPALPRRSPDLSIYAPSVAFSAKHRPGGVTLLPSLHGLDAYAALVWATRAHVRVLLVSPTVRVLSLYHDVPGGRLYLRWRLAGTPRHVAVVARRGGGGGGRGGGHEATGPAWMFDGMSVYHLGNDGWVAAHELDPNVWNKRKLKTVQAALAGGLGRQQLARARGRGVAAGVAGYPQLWWEEDEDGRCEAATTPAATAAADAAADAHDNGVTGADVAAPSLLVPPGGVDLGGGAAL